MIDYIFLLHTNFLYISRYSEIQNITKILGNFEILGKLIKLVNPITKKKGKGMIKIQTNVINRCREKKCKKKLN